MSKIAQVETALLSEADAALGTTVHKYESLPGSWNADALRRALQTSPGVYCAFIGGEQGLGGPTAIDANFDLYTVTKGPTEKERRRGGAVSIGAYEMMETLTARLASTSHALLQGLRWKRIANLFSEAMFELGGAVYVITVTLPNLELVPLSEAGWGDFITYHAEHSMATSDDEPDAIDEVALEQ